MGRSRGQVPPHPATAATDPRRRPPGDPAHRPRTRLDGGPPGPPDRGDIPVRHALAGRRRTLGDDHPDTQTTLLALDELPPRPHNRRPPPGLNPPGQRPQTQLRALMILPEHLAKAAAELGLSDHPVIVHASLRSFGQPVDGGADAILDVLLARGCTVLVPAFTGPQFGVPPPADLRPAAQRRRLHRLHRPAGPPGQAHLTASTASSSTRTSARCRPP